MIRLHKYIAECGIASRRKAEELIIQGKIYVNGKQIISLGVEIDENKDIVEYNNEIIKKPEGFVYYMLNKPEGFVTTSKDQFKRKTVMDLMTNVNVRVVPVGRLDYQTSGLLILCNDGDLTYKLTHPKHEIEKVYIAKLFGAPTEHQLIKFKRGLQLKDFKARPAKIEVLKIEEKYCTVKITITEGKNRQVRKMCDEIGHPVATLQRVAMGKLELKDLQKGKYRALTEKEIKYLKSL